MSRLGIFIADGCEEVEALTVVDIVRRAKLYYLRDRVGKAAKVKELVK